MDEMIEQNEEVAVEDEAVSEADKKPSDAKWYVVHTQSGYENKVKERIERHAVEKGMRDSILQVYVPSETVTEVRGGKRVNKEEKFFPGYVLVNMVMNDATWSLVRHTQGVSGFVGSHATIKESDPRIIPAPLKDEEVARMFEDKDDAKKKDKVISKIQIDYEIGEKVKVVDGPFMGLNGVVEYINYDKGKLTVRIEIFGRATPTEIDYTKVKKL